MDEILALENRRFEAMTNQDAQALDEILADDLSYTHSTARVETKAEFIFSSTSGRNKYRTIERDKVTVRQYGAPPWSLATPGSTSTTLSSRSGS